MPEQAARGLPYDESTLPVEDKEVDLPQPLNERVRRAEFALLGKRQLAYVDAVEAGPAIPCERSTEGVGDQRGHPCLGATAVVTQARVTRAEQEHVGVGPREVPSGLRPASRYIAAGSASDD